MARETMKMLREEIVRLENENGRLDRNYDELARINRDMHLNMANRERERDEARRQVEALELRLRELSGAISELRRQNQELEESRDGVQADARKERADTVRMLIEALSDK